ncbi:hypothetical protein [Chryseobacterium phocaeense]|uniref:hypothetical protein n=1 Tax=Chryseobacterium phocaeense TaxID=1816690 RepID=UPI001119396F|nr:hypothetical protein [Chryseobacterium phocaeense]
MKNFIILLSTILFTGCFSQNKISLRKANDEILKNRKVFPYSESNDSTMVNMLIKGYTTYRLLGAKTCNILPDKKYSHIYIEDGFNVESGQYSGVIIIDNTNICEIEANKNNLRADILSYTKIQEDYITFFTKKISKDDFKKKYLDEYFRYEIIAQNKTKDLQKCLAIDKFTPKPIIYAASYYFAAKKINNYGTVRIKYNDIKRWHRRNPLFYGGKKEKFYRMHQQS